MSNTAAMRDAWKDQVCDRAPLAGFTFHTGTRINVNRNALDAIAALDFVLAQHGYQVRKGETGSFCCRRITGGVGYSLHSYGIAVDINWTENPYQLPSQYARGLRTDMDRAMVADVLKIRTNNGRQVWGWGGDYTGNKDPMHFELHVAPEDLATGVVGVAPNQISAAAPDSGDDAARPQEAIDVNTAPITNLDGRGEFVVVDPTDGHIEDYWYDHDGSGPHHAPLGTSPGVFVDVSSHTADDGTVIVVGIGAFLTQFVILRTPDQKWADWVEWGAWQRFVNANNGG